MSSLGVDGAEGLVSQSQSHTGVHRQAIRLDVVTIFPDYVRVLDLSLMGKASAEGLIDLRVHDLRDWTTDRHRTVDDTPLGGGAGMVMKPDVWGLALDEVLGMADQADCNNRTHLPVSAEPTSLAGSVGEGTDGPQGRRRQVLVIPTPSGEVFTQRTAEDLAEADQIVFACGRYEGIDSRVSAYYASQGVEVRELSIGDYVLNGGEVASLVMIEAVARLRPGVLGNPDSVVEESHSSGLLEQEVYTRPVTWRGMDVSAQWPALLSGDHARIARQRRNRAITRTARRRPDMIAALLPESLDGADRAALAREGWLVPDAAARPLAASLRPALAEDVSALADLAGRTFPDACPPFLTAEHVAAHVRDILSPQRMGAWVADRRALVSVIALDETAELDLDGAWHSLPEGTLVGYSVVLLEQPDSEGRLVSGLDEQPRCVRSSVLNSGQLGEAAGGVLVAELSKVYVDARLRGSGAASLLLAEALCDADSAGVDVLWLGTHESNRRAQKAYRRAGFVKAGTRVYDVGGQRCRDVVMMARPASCVPEPAGPVRP